MTKEYEILIKPHLNIVNIIFIEISKRLHGHAHNKIEVGINPFNT